MKKGEEKKVVFHLRESQFAFLDEDMQWKVEEGTMDILLGSSSEKIELSGALYIPESRIIDGKTRGFYAQAEIY